MSIRNSAKAIIIKGDKLLLTKNRDEEGDFYLFPGGGQEHGETLHDALIRECMEETGCTVEVGELIHIREYIGKNHEHASFDSGLHQMEFYFRTTITGEQDTPQPPSIPDSHQVGTEWLDLQSLVQFRIYPKKIIPHLIGKDAPVYLGDMN
ncbi:NUDIX domain-containing protein [Bacillus sp. KH172YL63]|uniref:NUDIX domain-containing protein n=1 Tax=Bacillus sp. KH172YL63 TaxID=2709784 RepID=UPI0013E4640B|nr:NUDIX domain-containing protein [Bacillus sp. KH172YL63]BCB03681.1 DNA mismatch repair protein MutT [Bacillus sp. KH172YL63]